MAMSRTLISLDPELHEQARRRAAALGVSFAEYVRRVLSEDLAGPRRKADPSIVFDLGRSAGSDIARDKDAMIGAAVAGLRDGVRERKAGRKRAR